MSTDEIAAIHARLSKQDEVLSSIHQALVGNPTMGQDGLVPRVKSIEVRFDEVDRKLIRWSGMVAGAVLAFEFAKDRLLGK